MKIHNSPSPTPYNRPQPSKPPEKEVQPKDGYVHSFRAPDWLLPASAGTGAAGAFLIGGAMLASHVSTPLTVALGVGGLGALTAGFAGITTWGLNGPK